MGKYLITGAAGYIGSMLAKKIISSRQKVTVIARNPSRLDKTILSGAEAIQADIADREAILRIAGKF